MERSSRKPLQPSWKGNKPAIPRGRDDIMASYSVGHPAFGCTGSNVNESSAHPQLRSTRNEALNSSHWDDKIARHSSQLKSTFRHLSFSRRRIVLTTRTKPSCYI